MAEVKNSFLGSKMNQDLDDRLVPSNEYRHANNISVGKAEGSDIGVLQSIPGNELAGSTGNNYLTCIGKIADEANDRIFFFLTNYEDPSPSLLTRVPDAFLTTAAATGIMGQNTITLNSVNNTVVPGQTVRITPYNLLAPQEQIYNITSVNGNIITLNSSLLSNIPVGTIVAIEYSMSVVCFSTASLVAQTLTFGIFLNFAKNNIFNISGVNIIEDLLFWTDNRNQPRKININTALSNKFFYNKEDQISVAKYYPLTPMVLFDKATINSTNNATTVQGYTTFTTTIAQANLIKQGWQLVNATTEIADQIIVNNIIYGATSATVILTSLNTNPIITPSVDLIFYGSSMSNAADDPNWTGDAAFMQDKYIRFSYRYKFKDGEYSLMAPFSQIVFIPNQKGFFYSGDETRAYTSTIVEWVENYVNNILLHVELPQSAVKINSEYLIEKIDILYKESNSLAVKVLESVGISDIISNSIGNMYTYEYKSQSPYKTLPENQITRVYDRVPIRARAQESTGNRIIYGNFIATNTAPSNINYTVTYGEKDKQFENWVEYPNHNVKQNRTYQVGVILSDKYGRQSSVILSNFSKNSSIYVPFSQNNTPPIGWPGGVLNIIFNATINSIANEMTAEPGLYAIISGIIPGSSDGFQVDTVSIYDAPGYSSASYNNAITFTLVAPTTAPKNIPVLGGYLRGEYADYVKIIQNPSPNTYICDGTISSSYNKKPILTDIKYSYSINPLGWYSYKIVVKQQQQDYYNVYLPGMLNGYPAYQTSGDLGSTNSIFPNNEIGRIAHTVLINDNINKIPRDLTEVGPEQRQYRSSVNLFCRVENIGTGNATTSYNKQYFPTRKADVVSTIATSNELNFLPYNTDTNINGTASKNFYQLETQPYIARISTNNAVGTPAIPIISTYANENLMLPTLGIYETTPDSSLLEIFWESTTTGILSDLNEDILLGEDTVNSFSVILTEFKEDQDPNGAGNVIGATNSPYITNYFWPLSNGLPIDDSTILMQVLDQAGVDVSSYFILEMFPPIIPLTYKRYRIKISPTYNFVFNSDYAIKAVFNFTFTVTDNATLSTFLSYKNNVPLINITPEITNPSVDNTYLTIPVNSPGGNIIQFLGNNGSNSLSTTDTVWEINSVIPTTGNPFFLLDKYSGILNCVIQTAGTFQLAIKLTDAYDTPNNSPTPGSLSAIRTINVSADNLVIYSSSGTQSKTSNSGQGGTVQVQDEGILDFWQSFLPGEVVSSSNISCLGYGVPTSPYIPYSFSITYNGDFTYSWVSNRFLSPVSPSDPRATMPQPYYFQGTITTSLGRILNLGTIFPMNLQPAPWIVSSGGAASPPGNPFYFVSPVDTSYRPPTSANWSIKNNSAEESWFSGLSRLGNTILGGYISPGQTIVGGVDTGSLIDCIRIGSIKTEQNISPPFTITYPSPCSVGP